jgi:hypothetical protein
MENDERVGGLLRSVAIVDFGREVLAGTRMLLLYVVLAEMGIFSVW